MSPPSQDTMGTMLTTVRGSPESFSSFSSLEAVMDCEPHLPSRIPGAVVLSAPSISVLKQTANDVYHRLNSEASYANQFIVVQNITQSLQALLSGDDNPVGRYTRLTLDKQHQRAVFRVMPSSDHERVTHRFMYCLLEKLHDVGIHRDHFYVEGITRFRGKFSEKEPDNAFTPLASLHDNPEWPSLVIETGLSESDAQLRNDAYWWFSNSDYKVNIVLLISIERQPELRVTFKLFNLRSANTRVTRGLQAEVNRALSLDATSAQTASPSKPQSRLAAETTIVTATDADNTPLKLPFETLMRRPPDPNTKEGDLIFTTDDLRYCCHSVFSA
ncbi:hypothetical protein PDE_09996 [Penicillium oxalicum 114-2]|uniref:Uncharacterized protein n=1 Tax=Penicillium oxalicum (strain 114-2 / CGMCC 5302) TaxID=933388 RepID=S8A1K3_PENO1|nr:hypothetical protein PDE_09996 [Penicillium oxalicum 114-2]